MNRDSSGSMERKSSIGSPRRIGKIRFVDKYPAQILQVKICKKSEMVPGPGSYNPKLD